ALDAAERDLVASLAQSHAAHDPMRAIRARLLRAEGARRRGRRADATALLQRVTRAIAIAPPLVRARFQLMTTVSAVGGDADAAAAVSRAVASTGLAALPLYVTIASAAGDGSHGAADTFVDHLVGILRVCP